MARARVRERNSVGRWDETASTTMESVFSVELYGTRLKREIQTAHGVGYTRRGWNGGWRKGRRRVAG